MAGRSDFTFTATVDGIIPSVERDAKIAGPILQRELNKGAKGGAKGFDKALDRWKQPLGRISGDMGEFQKSLDASTARVLAFGASVGILQMVQRGFMGVLKAAHDVEKALMDINVVMELSMSGLDKFRDGLFDVARNTAQSFETVAEGATELARQGLSAEETLKRLESALILTRLSGLDAAESVATLTAAINSFGQVALTHTEIVNRMANVDAAFAVSSADLAKGLQRAAATAMSAKVSFNELLAVVTSVQQSTARGGSVIGNAFKSIFTRIQRSKVRETLEGIGVATQSANGEFRSAMSVLKDYANAYDTLTDAQKAYTAEQIAGVFQINNLKALVADLNSEFSIYDKALSTANKSTNQATKRNEDLNKTFAALLKEGQAAVLDLADSIGSLAMEGGFKTLLGGAVEFIDYLKAAFDKKEGSFLMRGMVKGLAGFLSGPGMILFALGLKKLFTFMGKQIGGAFKAIQDIGSEASKQKEREAAIGKILTTNKDLYHLIQDAAGDTAKQEKLILDHLRKENEEYRDTLDIVSRIAKQRSIINRYDVEDMNFIPRGSSTRVWSPNDGKAEGFIPNFAQGTVGAVTKEDRAIKKGVGGARKRAKPVPLKNFPLGKGKRGTVVANTDEFIVPNYKGGDGSAIFNRKMVQNLGLPRGARRITASGGLIPNFADVPLEGGYQREFKDYLKNAQNLGEQFFAKRMRRVLKGKNRSKATSSPSYGTVAGTPRGFGFCVGGCSQ